MSEGENVGALFDEIAKQTAKFPCLTGDKFLRQTVLSEECGEVARALIESESEERLKAELLQVAAYAFRWYCDIGKAS